MMNLVFTGLSVFIICVPWLSDFSEITRISVCILEYLGFYSGENC